MRIGKNSLLGLLFVSIVFLLNACVVEVKHNPYGNQPSHTASSFAYWYYYPNSQVYYHITGHYYYYRDGQRWIKATALPVGWVLNKSYRVRLKIAGSPYRQYAYHKRHYPPRHRSVNAPGEGRHGDDHGKHQGKDHGKGHDLFGKLTRYKTVPYNQQNKPEHANHDEGLDKRHQPEHVNLGKGPDKQHQVEHARAQGHMAPAKPNSDKSHGKPAKEAGVIAHGQGNPGKGGSQKANQTMGQRQPQGSQAKASYGQGGVKSTANAKVKRESSVSQQQRAGNTKHTRDAVTYKTAGKTEMKLTGTHQSTQALAHENKSAENHVQSQKSAGMNSPHNNQQAAKQHKASGKKATDKDKKGEKVEKTLAANQEDGDSLEEKLGNGKGKGKGRKD